MVEVDKYHHWIESKVYKCIVCDFYQCKIFQTAYKHDLCRSNIYVEHTERSLHSKLFWTIAKITSWVAQIHLIWHARVTCLQFRDGAVYCRNKENIICWRCSRNKPIIYNHSRPVMLTFQSTWQHICFRIFFLWNCIKFKSRNINLPLWNLLNQEFASKTLWALNR